MDKDKQLEYKLDDEIEEINDKFPKKAKIIIIILTVIIIILIGV